MKVFILKSHKIKTLIFKVLNSLPNKISYPIYHKIQKRTFSNLETKITANKNSHKIIQKILDESSLILNKKNILEIGSGWLPLMPYLFKINNNINTIYTYDINEHYSPENLKKIDTYFNKSFSTNFKYKNFKTYKIPDFIHYFPNCNITNTTLPNDISLYFSRFVLEHIPPTDIEKMHKKLYDEINHEAYILHLISPSDHRAYSDSSLSYYDFLKYSQKEWNTIQTKFDYHNRLRLPEYLDIFKKSGFDIIHLDYDKVDIYSTKYKKFKELNLHEDYLCFSEEEILAGSINVLLKKTI